MNTNRSSRRFEDRVVVVTGSSSGNGRAIARRFAAEGAVAVCCDVRESARPGGFDVRPHLPTHRLIEAEGGQALFVRCDATDARSLNSALLRASRRSGRIDVAVLNAGIFLREASILDETPDEHDRIMKVNERGVWLGLRSVARRMVAAGHGGRIVCVSSIAGLIGLEKEPAYSASKAAVIGLVRAAAVDLAPHRISVNAVCPGFIATAMLQQELADPARRAALEDATPWPRLGSADDVAAAVAFLASDDADWITGTALVVDGGYTCR